jgi:hypothetical protein
MPPFDNFGETLRFVVLLCGFHHYRDKRHFHFSHRRLRRHKALLCPVSSLAGRYLLLCLLFSIASSVETRRNMDGLDLSIQNQLSAAESVLSSLKRAATATSSASTH